MINGKEARAKEAPVRIQERDGAFPLRGGAPKPRADQPEKEWEVALRNSKIAYLAPAPEYGRGIRGFGGWESNLEDLQRISARHRL